MANGNGHEFGHSHSPEDIESEQMLLDESHPIWASERIVLTSAGIDIGSTTSHLLFSQLVLRRQGISLSSRFQIVSKKLLYESPILITPFLDGNVIDTAKLSDFIARAYKESGIKPEEVNTGAVIITGETARKDNAEAIANMFSAQAGKFVCAVAGPNLEAKMAAYGSGAVELTYGGEGISHNILNVDVGGGTSKFAICRDSGVVETAAINVGARLFVLDDKDHLVRIEAPGEQILKSLGLSLKLGDIMDHETQHKVCRQLAVSLVEVIKRGPLSPLTKDLLITPPITFKGPINHLIFSGGVSEYIYDCENNDFGDLGRILAGEIKELCFKPEFPIPVQPSLQRIRSTVIGASQYTVQVSGSTIFLSDNNALPIRNLLVVAPRIDETGLTVEKIKTAVLDSFTLQDLNPEESGVAIAVRWKMGPAYENLRNLCEGICAAMSPAIEHGLPLVLVFDADVGRLVGNILTNEMKTPCPVLSIDGIELQDFDYIDIGELIPDAQVVPVVIKSLVFRT